MSLEENNINERYKSAIDSLTNNSSRISEMTKQISLFSTPISSQLQSSLKENLDKNLLIFGSITKLLPQILTYENHQSLANLSRTAIASITQLNSIPFLSEYEKNIQQNPISNTARLLSASLTANDFLKNYDSSRLSSIIGTDITSRLLIHNDIIKATELSIYAEKSIVNLSVQNIGSKLNANLIQRSKLFTNFIELSQSYNSLYESFERNPLYYSQLDPVIKNVIPSEYYTCADTLEILSLEQESETREEILIKDEIKYENEILLSTHLPKLNSDLYDLWKGAIQAYTSDNVEKPRHFITSIRELYTHVFQIISPNKDIEAWNKSPELYHNGKPTRKARLLYLCRKFNNEEMKDFVDKDITSTLELINLFQKGTHSIKSKLGDKELAIIKSKAENTLKFLLEIHFSNF
ncbi:hypothetical protein H3Z85_04425 [Chryseobacterium indologenes]|uniref:pPIWI-associating nuclease domain-containing protein n=1 Tax=Chryseobacterium indologenes TaxID=253 RepID=UPI00111414F4|nr:hypothetical protein [Chryseobacterium indologenes]QPQ52694.1 hypothetical protein H3Z85_04425 [Chryseobacterium indologenes]